jgi:hypothetical protein
MKYNQETHDAHKALLEKYRTHKTDAQGDYSFCDLNKAMTELGIKNAHGQLRQSKIKEYQDFMELNEEHSYYFGKKIPSRTIDVDALTKKFSS